VRKEEKGNQKYVYVGKNVLRDKKRTKEKKENALHQQPETLSNIWPCQQVRPFFQKSISKHCYFTHIKHISSYVILNA